MTKGHTFGYNLDRQRLIATTNDVISECSVLYLEGNSTRKALCPVVSDFVVSHDPPLDEEEDYVCRASHVGYHIGAIHEVVNSYNDQAVREGIWRQMPGLNEGMGRRKIVEINVEDVEKRKDPSKHYVGISVGNNIIIRLCMYWCVIVGIQMINQIINNSVTV